MKSDNLELLDVSIAREGAMVLPPITQRLKSGDVLAIRGRNGSGKSTLLKAVAGLLPLAGGQILFNGKPLLDAPDFTRSIVYVGHKRGVEPGMSVKAHVSFWAGAFKSRELIGAALHYFDLEDIADVPVHTLSAGWQQRVALTRLILQPGKIWLLDEPTAGLDDDGMRLLNGIIESRTEQGGMILIASHAPFAGDKVQVLDLNTLTQQGGRDGLHAH
jgi:heme exporter protein A